MILRKPYAFLIKHFKLIHLILTAILLFIVLKTNKLLSFLNSYIDARTYDVIDNLSEIYLGPYIYLAIFLAIMFSFIIFMLMRAKDKPLKYYLILIAYYIVLFLDLIFVSAQLNNIAFNKVDVLLLRIGRDSLLVMVLGQVPFLLISLVRAIGFNIKKFNFQKDLMELQTTENDNEEFELDIDIDNFDVKTRFRRRLRNAKYVFKENKVLILLATGIVLVISGVILHNNFYVKNRVYKENEVISSFGLKLTVLNSYQLDTDDFGNDITKNKNSYTVARVKVKNDSKESITFALKKFSLIIKDKIYQVDIKDKNYFLGLGTTSSDITVDSGMETVFIVIFKIDKDLAKSNKVLEYTSGYKVNNGERIYINKRINLNPLTIKKPTKVNEAKIGEKLTFNKTILGNSSIIINNFEIANRFTYEYKQCKKECYTFKDFIVPTVNTSYNAFVIKIDANIDIDSNIYNEKLNSNLLSEFGHIRYVIDGKEYNQSFNMANVTPNTVNDYKYYEIAGETLNADNIYLDFIIMDKIYTYVLK